jgi:hypothetical protein
VEDFGFIDLPIAVEKIPNNPRGWVPHGLFPEPFTDRVVGIWPSMLVFLMVVRVVHDGY